jgi:hypothetical protein
MNRALKILLALSLFALYVLLCQYFYDVLNQRVCQPDTAIGQESNALCSASGPSGNLDLGMESPYWLWLLMLGMPALPVLVLYAGIYSLYVWKLGKDGASTSHHSHRRRRRHAPYL